MKVTISCSGGVLRSLHLASQLDGKGYLHKLHTPFYSHKHSYLTKILRSPADSQIIDVKKVQTDLKFTVLRKLMVKGRVDKLIGIDSKFVLGEIFDKDVAKRIDDGADIVFAESNIALLTIKKAKELGMTTVLDRTNSHIEYQTELLKEEYEKFGIKYIFNSQNIVEKGVKEYREADYICVLSSFVKRTFLEKGTPESKLLLVPSGVELADFRQTNKEDDIFRIICCGLSCIKKGTHYLLEAFKQLNLKNAELWLIGGIFEDIKPLLKKYEGHYKSIGFVPHKELYRYFSQGSAFVLPSLEEGLAKVMMEAMACGLPVIATTNTGAEDVVRDKEDGFIVPIRDVEALKEKILYMYENQNTCRQMGQNAKNRVKEGFTWENYADRMVCAFREILKEKSR
mgnify:CR=1 FL=1